MELSSARLCPIDYLQGENSSTLLVGQDLERCYELVVRACESPPATTFTRSCIWAPEFMKSVWDCAPVSRKPVDFRILFRALNFSLLAALGEAPVKENMKPSFWESWWGGMNTMGSAGPCSWRAECLGKLCGIFKGILDPYIGDICPAVKLYHHYTLHPQNSRVTHHAYRDRPRWMLAGR